MQTFTIQRGGPIFKPNPVSTTPVKEQEPAEQTDDNNKQEPQEEENVNRD